MFIARLSKGMEKDNYGHPRTEGDELVPAERSGMICLSSRLHVWGSGEASCSRSQYLSNPMAFLLPLCARGASPFVRGFCQDDFTTVRAPGAAGHYQLR